MTDTRLPPLRTGRRRGLLRSLVGVAAARALLAVAGALLVGAVVTATRPGVLAGVLALTVAGTGLATYGERVLAERLGQDYVHELRGRLVAAALGDDGGPSLGVTIARTTNDLTAVRSWVTLGLVPLLAALPLVLAAVVVLGFVHPMLGAAVVVPLGVLGLLLWRLAPSAFARARLLRRERGRMAGRITDTLQARDGIRVAGGTDRERARLRTASRTVADAAVARARVAGVLQGAALATAAAMAGGVAVTGRAVGLGAGEIATALVLVGVVGAGLGETGRIVEYRQNHRAAERVIAPQVHAGRARPVPAPPVPAPPVPAPPVPRRIAAGRGLVRVGGLDPSGAVLGARAGQRVHLRAVTPEAASDALRRVALGAADVVVDGFVLARLDHRARRTLGGHAAAGTPLERGTVARAVRYRRPDLPASAASSALARVGLDARVAGLRRGERTELRRGGAPLDARDRALLHLARACLGDPPLLLLDRLDGELDDAGRATLRELVASYPGVVVFTSEHPERVRAGAVRFDPAG